MEERAAALKLLQALAEPTRLQITEMLSCGELCACQLLDGLSVSQSTLSHHMKVLTDCGLVSGRKEATWMYYTLRMETVEQFHRFIDELMKPKADCICKTAGKSCRP